MDWKKLLGVAVAIGLLFLSFYKVNLRELWSSIAQLNFLYLFASFCSAVAMNWAKGMRWRALIREVKPVSKTRMFALFHVGQMINLSLPALTGQAGRIVMLSKAEGLSKTLCFTTVAMEVLFDGISLIVLVYLASFIFGSASSCSLLFSSGAISVLSSTSAKPESSAVFRNSTPTCRSGRSR